MHSAAPSTGSTATSGGAGNGSSLVVFVMRRLAVTIPLLLIISFGVFALVHIAPGDPVRSLLGARAPDPATVAAIRARYHLDDPFLVQYGKWLSQVIRGDLGVSIQGNRAVTSTIADRLGVTIFLSLMSTILVLGLGILLGAVAAFRRGTRLDRAVVMFSVFGISSPAFVTGIFLLYLFGVLLHWFPIFGPGKGFLDRAWHLALPALALATSVMAIVVKITRAAMIEELARDYVTFARARGLSSRRILFAYVLRNSLIPVVTAAGLIVVGIVAGAIYVEVTFSLPGLGASMVDAIQKRDIPTIQGTTLLFSAFVLLVNLAVDVIYTLIDPRIRFGRVES
ncbi:ABC transporter permease [Sinorhizobium chiapasense]|uniref:ABC transporter permease n=1 Tax=Sinorhizobium chiapasense TaxID=501572 RepID=A0ABZ2BBN3_9HYPH